MSEPYKFMTDDDIEVLDDEFTLLNKIIENCVKLSPNDKYALAFAQSLEEQLIELDSPQLQRIHELIQLLLKYEEKVQRCKIIRQMLDYRLK